MFNDKIIGYVISHTGFVRKNNEDNFLLGHCLNENAAGRWSSQFCQNIGLWTCAAVFDGMGGIEGGEIASYLAAQVFQEATLDIKNAGREDLTEVMEHAYEKANSKIIEERKKHSTCGTTGTAVVTNGKEFRIFHRGDSRAYLKRGKQLKILSKDHTLAQLKKDVGIYRCEDEIPEKEYHQLIEFIGMEMDVEHMLPFETEWERWQLGDCLMLCSDGLYDMCGDELIFSVLDSETCVQKAANALMQLALENGGKDNVTILMLEIQ